MSLIANLYGRLGGDPVARTTKSGKDMTTVQVAVDVTPRDAAAPETLWF
ncbi:single-stranded DNA-binding protein [uncultured Lamprocystis sp.]|jgi:single-strand DNA-binding protein|nr:single-stranded DNA-binding protein [uncultured Lamprocystis sp.]